MPAGPAGQATSIKPTGLVVAGSTKAPDAAWELVKYIVSPEAQTQLMQLKAAVPVDKSVLAGPYATAFPGSDVFAAAIDYAHLKPSFRGYNEWTTRLQDELDTNVFNAPNKTVRDAIDSVLPDLDAILAANAQ
jgi:multiple sugar transport system substrate-binding protein